METVRMACKRREVIQRYRDIDMMQLIDSAIAVKLAGGMSESDIRKMHVVFSLTEVIRCQCNARAVRDLIEASFT